MYVFGMLLRRDTKLEKCKAMLLCFACLEKAEEIYLKWMQNNQQIAVEKQKYF